MPTYVPHYQYDVFVSYAHVDNDPLPGTEEGWVTNLIGALKILLAQKLGRADAYSLWIDPQLKGNEPFNAELIAKVRKSATLVMILSPGYLDSEWCQWEFITFLETAPLDSGRLFIVEREPVEARPTELQDLTGYRFWTSSTSNKPRPLGVPKPSTDPMYYHRLFDLAEQLADKLKDLRRQYTSPMMPLSSSRVAQGESSTRTSIFLAEVPDDLQDSRTEVENYLTQYGYNILPEATTLPYSFSDAQQLQAALQKDLQRSTLFVQLLNSTNPRRRPGMSTPQLQYTTAYSMAPSIELPILQWRDPQLNLATIADPAYRALLDASTVMAMSLEEFKQYILRQLQAIEEQKRLEAQRQATEQALPTEGTSDNGTLVFVNTSQDDLEYAHEIVELLSAQGIDLILPVFTASKQEEIREDLENNLLECDALIVLYATTSFVWVRNQLRYYLRVYRKRKQPLKSIVLCSQSSPDKPPLGTPPLGVSITNLQVFEFELTMLRESSCVSTLLQMLHV